MERSTIFNGKIHYKLPFSIAMLNYQMVGSINKGTPKWMVYKGQPFFNGRFRVATILGNPIWPIEPF